MINELINKIVNRIKKIESLKIPNYELPADSFLEDLAIDIILMVHEYNIRKIINDKE